jgi:flagellar biosynthesis protein
MKRGHSNYFSALNRYEQEANRLLEAPQRHSSAAKEIIKRAEKQNVPLQKDETLLEQLADEQHRVPSQL